MSEFRVYVEKKANFAVEAEKLKFNLINVLGITKVKNLRIFNCYEISGITSEIFNLALNGVFSEPQVDQFCFSLPKLDGLWLGVEFLPGQFDCRADFCQQCVQLLDFDAQIRVKTAKIYFFDGNLTDKEIEKIKNFLINPIECRQFKIGEKINFDNISKINFNDGVEILNGFNDFDQKQLEKFQHDNYLAIDVVDLKLCQQYFKFVEKRPPTIAEIKVLDTYWSDHCRHTTFLTNLYDVEITDSKVKTVFENYVKVREQLGITESPVSLMNLATLAAKKLKHDGKLASVDDSDEINACSVNVEVKTKTGLENWLLVFKNETHNHPTEIEPFGGAATCIGGAIRDPLSARAYVFQAMRITGAANPLEAFENTLPGKLPQRKIVTTAAEGYSSYGNQIGVATGFVQEIYYPKFVAKRLELGAVIGGVPKKNVVKIRPTDGDIIVLLGGKTGRDGCGGATGSSKVQNTGSINDCSAQVQKGNPVEERKLQRFFRNEKVSKLIKRCNDFGAGGVCVAIGELADGLEINLNAVLKKYEGLSPVELAISESQERMAAVVDKKNLDFFLKQAEDENLLATPVAVVTNSGRLVLKYSDKKIVDLSREFLSSNGAKRRAKVETGQQKFTLKFDFVNSEQGWYSHFSRLNLCSQKGLVEMFDSTIGAGCVLMPYGGKFQATKAQAMAFTFPTKSECETSSLMAFGFNPFLMEQSTFYGSQYAVIESIAKIVAVGGSVSKCWLTFQEYFPSLKNDSVLWGKAFLALLGAFNAQTKLNVAAIGGKDSMSGTFENLEVVPTFVSFAVSVADVDNVISNEFKQEGSKVAIVLSKYGVDFEPDYDSVLNNFNCVENLIKNRQVESVYALGFGGIAQAVCEMCFGNKIGFEFIEGFDEKQLNYAFYGSFLVELKKECETEVLNTFSNVKTIGRTVSAYKIKQKTFEVDLNKVDDFRFKTLESVFPTRVEGFSKNKKHKTISCEASFDQKWPLIKIAKVRVLVPVFPGTNCEFDLTKKFEIAGAECVQFVVNNLDGKHLLKSVENFVKELKLCQIVAIAGGFSAGDEPEGSAKFIAAFFRNYRINEELTKFLNLRDGLMIGICNGFQALLKLGLIEHGKITLPTQNMSTLTYNEIGRHQSKLVRTRICCNNSPWLSNVQVGDIFTVPISNGEGRFVAPDETLKELEQNCQIVTQYVDYDGKASMNIEHNPSGSFMAIEGLVSKNGRILGKMGHNERVCSGLFKNIGRLKEHKIFEAGVNYFKKFS